MIGRGTAFGAITVINATATGIGCAMAIDAPTSATWQWHDANFEWQSPIDDALARSIHARVATMLGREGAKVDCTTPFPPSRGLKTSSAAATAMIRAALDGSDVVLDADALDALSVQCAKDAGVTLTGALDDQMAVSRGGCHIADNRAGIGIGTVPTQAWHVAVWVPQASIPKRVLGMVDPAPVKERVEAAMRRLDQGDIAAAMTDNGAAYHDLYRAAGLPVTDAPVRAALSVGAVGAGLSGTGPSVAALFEQPTEVPAVDGGTWHWHRVVPEAT